MRTIVLKTKPIPVNQKYGVINGRLLLTKVYRETKEALSWEIRSQVTNKPLTDSVALNVLFYYGDKRKRDIDAYLKILLDAMTGIVYEDDNQVTELHVYKDVDKEEPRTEILVL